MSERAPFTVRFYEPRDRAAVRRICCQTGYLGTPIDPVFEDYELFADYLTSYYTDVEPEHTVVLEIDGEIKGYVMGCLHPGKHSRYEAWHNVVLALTGAWRYFTRPYNAATRRYVKWIIRNSRKEMPVTPKNTPHFHFNVVPEARKIAHTAAALQKLLERFHEKGAKAIYAQMVQYEDRRSSRMFEHYGFQSLGCVEVTKFREVYPKKIFLHTILKDLTQNPNLYGLDLARERKKQARAATPTTESPAA
ncbi:MAG: hypothetical protein B9S32_16440 [Verrucomicrobia bacterium Tous-C9LFEB]|nr:MAG: hypothetical protein B9S32_16440 [Verrucomicrobia bacterium Tous-C9LFEB]